MSRLAEGRCQTLVIETLLLTAIDGLVLEVTRGVRTLVVDERRELRVSRDYDRSAEGDDRKRAPLR